MVTNNLFRFAMILSSGQAKNFRTNLKKLVELVLYDSFGTPMKLLEIQTTIEKQFSLVFSDSELLNVIKSDKDIIINANIDPVNNTYELQPLKFKNIQVKQTVNIDDYILKFLDDVESEEKREFKVVKELIYKFLYFSFNSDTKTVLELMNRKTPNFTINCVSDEFSPDEAKIINDFLNWDYSPKNEFVLNLISSCFDYCMLTVKKDTTSYNNIFNGKEFYLDSNIIFRLAGFNKIERQTSLNAFIKKCVDSGIKIYYTNHTYFEIKETIKYYVDVLKRVVGKQHPLSVESMQSLSSKYANLDFHDIYFEWCKIPTNTVGDFDSFRKYLIQIVDNIIRPFKLVSVENYNVRNNRARFAELFEDFKSYKAKHYKNTYEGAINVDINNYLYILNKASVNDSSDFMQLKYYFITADHCLTEWATIQRPGIVPMFVLPSVWYSILLKYKGRTEEDYAAFCQFLNIRIAPERDAQLDQKRIMLAHIIELNEEPEIKEQIVFDIKNRLSDPQVEIEDPIAFVEESHKTILQSKIDAVRAELGAQHSKDLKQTIEGVEAKHLLENQQLEQSTAQQIKQTKEESFALGEDHIIQKQAEKIVKRHRGISVAFWIVIALLISVSLLTFITSWIIGDKKISNEMIQWVDANSKAISIVSFLGSALLGVLKVIFKLTNWFSTDKNYIVEKLCKEYKQ